MRALKLFTLLAIPVIIVSCSSIKVVADQEKNIDFSKYKTYSFLGWQNHSEKNLSQEDKVLLRDAFTKEFEQRGMQKVNSAGDMEISLYIVISEESAVSGYNDYVAKHGSYNYYSRGYASSNNTYSTQSKMVGTLIMNVYDRNSKDQVWQAIATKTVTENQKKRKQTIPASVRSIMRYFPVNNK